MGHRKPDQSVGQKGMREWHSYCRSDRPKTASIHVQLFWSYREGEWWKVQVFDCR